MSWDRLDVEAHPERGMPPATPVQKRIATPEELDDVRRRREARRQEREKS